eukprot:2175016-Rhodomonas_salina.1
MGGPGRVHREIKYKKPHSWESGGVVSALRRLPGSGAISSCFQILLPLLEIFQVQVQGHAVS